MIYDNTLVRMAQQVEIYYENINEYKTVHISSIQDNGNHIVVVIYDNGLYRTILFRKE